MRLLTKSGALSFLSTPSARRATASILLDDDRAEISIHALREEGDSSAEADFAGVKHISIHALREEGDN